jgi:hypothetical protein
MVSDPNQTDRSGHPVDPGDGIEVGIGLSCSRPFDRLGLIT